MHANATPVPEFSCTCPTYKDSEEDSHIHYNIKPAMAAKSPTNQPVPEVPSLIAALDGVEETLAPTPPVVLALTPPVLALALLDPRTVTVLVAMTVRVWPFSTMTVVNTSPPTPLSLPLPPPLSVAPPPVLVSPPVPVSPVPGSSPPLVLVFLPSGRSAQVSGFCSVGADCGTQYCEKHWRSVEHSRPNGRLGPLRQTFWNPSLAILSSHTPGVSLRRQMRKARRSRNM